MNELHFSLLEMQYLLRAFKIFFNPFVLTNKNESILSFDNDKGRGIFEFFFQKNEFLNISFRGTLKEELNFQIVDKELAIYAMYINRGIAIINSNSDLIKLDASTGNQIVFKNDTKLKTNISVPANIYLDFNFMKINNLGSQEKSQILFYNFLHSSRNSILSNVRYTLNNGRLIFSQKVGDERIEDLKNQIVSLKQFHSKHVSRELEKA